MRASCWSQKKVKEGEYGTKITEWPHKCEECNEHDEKLFGCGYSGKDGLGDLGFDDDRITGIAARTCPQFYARQPMVISIMNMVGDYRRGALGDVRDLGNATLSYLQVADAELNRWDYENDKQLYDK